MVYSIYQVTGNIEDVYVHILIMLVQERLKLDIKSERGIWRLDPRGILERAIVTMHANYFVDGWNADDLLFSRSKLLPL